MLADHVSELVGRQLIWLASASVRLTTRRQGGRTEAAAAWMRQTFSVAEASTASAVVIALHGNPFDEEPRNREPFQPFLVALEEEVGQFRRPVLVAHGDDHRFTVDRPLELANLTRLDVPGSPEVGRVRVKVMPGARKPFAFEIHVIPRWKYW